jgi:ATP-dependent DNA ligase
MITRRSSAFIPPCLPSKVTAPPSGPLWVHEIKHDGYRLMVRRDCPRVRCFTRNGHDWADRFPAIVDAALGIKAASFLIDGEAVVARSDGSPDFHALRTRRNGHAVALYAFDLIEHDGDDLCSLSLLQRKRQLAKLVGKDKERSIQLVEHLTGDGPTIFDQSAAWDLRASSRSEQMRRIALGRQRRGSRRRTPRATQSAASARRSGGLQGGLCANRSQRQA